MWFENLCQILSQNNGGCNFHIDGAPYHKYQTIKAPTMNDKKAGTITWLWTNGKCAGVSFTMVDSELRRLAPGGLAVLKEIIKSVWKKTRSVWLFWCLGLRLVLRVGESKSSSDSSHGNPTAGYDVGYEATKCTANTTKIMLSFHTLTKTGIRVVSCGQTSLVENILLRAAQLQMVSSQSTADPKCC
ncbi:unnamed protein product [Phytophthora fragariaefolia]|uniref:Unnamed protein product n=1 Tax=Phytophthora fragariaefolia TaxID=1490495 RepID=A0A9W6YMD3_9STRA|nr:unnamed protein product [Phytophthora fragariaefolia]GMF80096.1 unnamed protein product [Phytophthora fragariaefolia]